MGCEIMVYSYYGVLHSRMAEADDERYLGLSITDACRYACGWIKGREGYVVHISRKNEDAYRSFKNYYCFVYYDGKAYYKGKTVKTMVRINPKTGKAYPKKKEWRPFGL